jgi:hypothetical protein
MQPRPVTACIGRGLVSVADMVVGFYSEVRRWEYAKGQELRGMLRKHPGLLTLSVPPHKM